MYPISDDQDFIAELLAAEKVLLVQGTGFNWPHPDHFRLVFLPHEDDLREAIGRIARFFDRLSQTLWQLSGLGRRHWRRRRRGRAGTGWRVPSRCTASCVPICRGTMHYVCARSFSGGARMMLATQGDAVLGVAVWRVIQNTYEGCRLYVDDLVTDAAHRSRGVGRFLLDGLEARARSLGCDVIALDSGTQRTAAHRFYFREGFVIPVSASGNPSQMKPINVGLLGIGTVGGGTFTVLSRNEAEITRRAGRPIRITKVADKNLELARQVTAGAPK
jgi:GNAT superfamily N-acetyltransferase